ncbi:MAG TPA: hypothetical protein VH520_04030 [Streptosporangiaceae bacterium]
MRTALIWSAVVVVASVIAGAGGYEIGLGHSHVSSGAPGTSVALSGACPAGVTVPDPSATSPAGSALLARLLPIPTADTRTTGGEQQGVVSLTGFVNALYSNNPNAEQPRLEARCFQTAVHREWTSPGGTITSVWLIQFGTAAGARSYTLADEQASAADPKRSDAFPVSHVADGMGYGQPSLDQDGNTRTAMLGDAGNIAIIINLFVPAKLDNSGGALVLQQQSALLTSGSS